MNTMAFHNRAKRFCIGLCYGVFLMALSGNPAAASLPVFEDVLQQSIYYSRANTLKQRAITYGCSAIPSMYCLDSNITRGQAAVLIIRSIYSSLSGNPEQFSLPQSPYFSDVPSSHPQFAYIQKLRELGITNGCGPVEFCPEDSVTYSQLAVFMIRARQIRDNGSVRPLNCWQDYWCVPYFPQDVPETHMHFAFVQKAYEMLGNNARSPSCPYGSFCPDLAITRGAATVHLIDGILAAPVPTATASNPLCDFLGPSESNYWVWGNGFIPVGGQVYSRGFTQLHPERAPVDPSKWTFTVGVSLQINGVPVLGGVRSRGNAGTAILESTAFTWNPNSTYLHTTHHMVTSICLENDSKLVGPIYNEPYVHTLSPTSSFAGQAAGIEAIGSFPLGSENRLRLAKDPNPNTYITSLTSHTLRLVTANVAAPASGQHQLIIEARARDENGLPTNDWLPSIERPFAVYDPTPLLNPLNPSSGVQGTPPISMSLTGSNFGTNPAVCIMVSGSCNTSFEGVTITRGPCGASCNTQIPVTINISEGAAVINYTIGVISNGISGTGFLSAPGGASQAQSNTQTFQVQPLVITPQVTSGASTINQGQCIYINAAPTMPALAARLVASNGQQLTGTVTWQLRILFDQQTATSTIHHTGYFPPFSPIQLPGSQTWDISSHFGAPGSLIRGGQAFIDWSYNNGPQQQFPFCIRGMNPAEATVLSELQQYLAPWFLKNIFYHETRMAQFCEAGVMDVEYCLASNNNWGMPVFGPPGGYGLGQLDPPPGLDAIWNWKSNVAASISLLESKQGPPQLTTNNDNRAYPFWMRQIRDWNVYNANSPGPTAPIPQDDLNPNSPGIQPQCRFTFAEAPITGVPGTYWFGDAIWMKQYAGAPQNYISWDNLTDPNNPRWVINRANPVENNVVGEFCTCESRQTCRTDLTQ